MLFRSVDRTEVLTATELDDCLDAIERLVYRRSGTELGEFGLQTLDRAWITNVQIEAARVAHRRTRALRELLMEWEDAGCTVRVSTRSDRHLDAMRIHAVGLDHIVLTAGDERAVVPFEAITVIEATP